MLDITGDPATIRKCNKWVFCHSTLSKCCILGSPWNGGSRLAILPMCLGSNRVAMQQWSFSLMTSTLGSLHRHHKRPHLPQISCTKEPRILAVHEETTVPNNHTYPCTTPRVWSGEASPLKPSLLYLLVLLTTSTPTLLYVFLSASCCLAGSSRKKFLLSIIQQQVILLQLLCLQCLVLWPHNVCCRRTMRGIVSLIPTLSWLTIFITYSKDVRRLYKS